MALPPSAPQPVARPALYRYYRERGLSLAEVGAVFGKSAEWVRLACLPFDDPRRLVPSAEDVALAHRWTGGEIGPADWYPPELSAGPPASRVEA